jgi:hypothetical protein
LPTGGAGGELEAPELLRGQGGLLVGVVLFAGEHAVEEHREFARDGDDRGVVAAAGCDPLVEGVHGSGLLGDRAGGFDQRPAGLGRALF